MQHRPDASRCSHTGGPVRQPRQKNARLHRCSKREAAALTAAFEFPKSFCRRRRTHTQLQNVLRCIAMTRQESQWTRGIHNRTAAAFALMRGALGALGCCRRRAVPGQSQATTTHQSKQQRTGNCWMAAHESSTKPPRPQQTSRKALVHPLACGSVFILCAFSWVPLVSKARFYHCGPCGGPLCARWLAAPLSGARWTGHVA